MHYEISAKIDFENEAELLELARIHESAPLNWNPDYKVTSERLHFWVKYFREHAEKSGFFTAKTGNQIVGFHWLTQEEKYNAPCAHIHSLWVHDDFRKHGIGGALKAAGEKWAKARGAEFIVTEVFYDNKRMLDYNLKRGFKARQVEMVKELT